MSELQSALDALAAVDVDALSPPEQLEFIRAATTGINRLQAIRSGAVRSAEKGHAQAEDGAVSMKAWLRGHCHLSPTEARTVVSTARRLESLPAVAEAFSSGAISAHHADVIASAVTPERQAQAAAVGVDMAETDRILADVAVATTPDETARAVRRWVMGIDPDGTLDDAADVRRSLSMVAGLDGRVFLREHLDAVGARSCTALAALMNGDRPAGDTRSHGERQGHALVALARGALDAGCLPLVRGERPHVRVTIDVEALAAERGAPGVAGGELSWAGPIGPETARRIACDSLAIRVLTDSASMPLDSGRAQRTAPASIRRAVEIRDGHCVFAG